MELQAHISLFEEYEADMDVDVHLDQWNFNLWDLTRHENGSVLMEAVCTVIFVRLDLPNTFNIPASAFLGFLRAIRDRMSEHEAPYHNFVHAVDALQTLYVTFMLGGDRLFSPLERFALCVAALCHDLDHPGLSNAYHVAAGSPLAIRYNDTAVLESHHAAVAFEVMADCNIFVGLEPKQYKTARKLVILAILATDMTVHFDLLHAVNQALEMPSTVALLEREGSVAEDLPEGVRETMVRFIMHVADISNPTKPWSVSRCVGVCGGVGWGGYVGMWVTDGRINAMDDSRVGVYIRYRAWSDALLNEYFAQGDREKEEGLPISPNMDRDSTDQVGGWRHFVGMNR
jgi:cAMP-specific phosphodiesterase 4